MYAFAVGWGFVVSADFILRILGMATHYSVDVGLIFPYLAPIMSMIVIFAFVYFLTNANKELGKKFYASCNLVMLAAFSGALALDLLLRVTAFDQTYCRGAEGEEFTACKDEAQGAFWLDILKIVLMLRTIYYSVQVLEKIVDTPEK